MTDFFESNLCGRKHLWQRRRIAPLFDMLFDGRIAPQMRSLRRQASAVSPRKVLVVSVEDPERPTALNKIFASFKQSRHDVTTSAVPMGSRGKFQNINLALQDFQLDQFDWIIVTDNDVQIPQDFLNIFLYVADALDLQIAQPAHRCLSYTSFNFNYRRWNSLGRVTHYVEDGPITAFRRDVIPRVLPFPEMRWGWATDLAWCAMAAQEEVPIGIVDCTPMEHLRPVAENYPVASAVSEARAFLAKHHIVSRREELFVDTKVVRAL
ncbi:MAG: hypothetical protein ACRYFY_22795 [Janthinobacterium lividum]